MINKDVAIRAYTHVKQENKVQVAQVKPTERKRIEDRVLVFDTETTTDIYQNLIFGSCRIYQFTQGGNIFNALSSGFSDLFSFDNYRDDYILEKEIIFYIDNISKSDLKVLTSYCKENNVELVSKSEFISEIFIKEVWEKQALCVGFNLPFDLSRIAMQTKIHQRGKYKDSFELVLKHDLFTPTIAIKNIDSKKAFIELTKPAKTTDRKPYFNGNFLDLRTLVFALTNESYSLNKACKIFGVCDCKHDVEEHGKVNDKYIDYNRHDVHLTWELFKKAKEEFEKHPIQLPITKAYSPASIGKSYFKAMNIQPLLVKQPDFNLDVLGKSMSAYYGGRAECHIRKTPTKVLYTDVTSMYPTVFTLQNLWSWVIADKLEVEENTEYVIELLNDITLDKLFDKDIWTKIPALVEVLPSDDILPIRAKYGGTTYQIGVNKVTSKQSMYYTLADIIVSKLLTGKTPNVLKAYTIKIGVPQKDLKPVSLKGEIEVDPTNCNFFKTVIEQRSIKKGEMKAATDQIQKDQLGSLQLFLKILANSTSYGIFIELITKNLDKEKPIEVFGLENFPTSTKDIEENGYFCNPLLACMITGASRLILGMIEALIHKNGLNYVFCDTDSMAIALTKNNDLDKALQIVDRFKSLNPYNEKYINGSILKIEDENYFDNCSNNGFQDLYCYMISSKRYVLYNIVDGEFNIRKKSDHGLGHLKSPVKNIDDWINDIWLYVLNVEYGKVSYTKAKCWDTFTMGQHTISKPNIYKSFANINKNKDYENQIKPYNFISIWYTDKMFSNSTIISPYTSPNEFNNISDNLIDRITGKAIDPLDLSDGNGNYSIKTYGEIIQEYMYHPESKFVTDKNKPCTKNYKGVLKRTHITIDKIIQIGKEVNQLEESMVFGVDENTYSNYINNTWNKIKTELHELNNIEIHLINNGFTKENINEFLASDSIDKNIVGLFNKLLISNNEIQEKINYVQIDTTQFNKYCYVPYWNNKIFKIRLLVEINDSWYFIKNKNYRYLIKNHLIQNKSLIDVLKECDFNNGVFSTKINNYPEFISYKNCLAIWHLKDDELTKLITEKQFNKYELKSDLISREGIFRVMQNYIPKSDTINLDTIKLKAKKGNREFEFSINDIDSFMCKKREGNSNKAEVLIKVKNEFYYLPIKDNPLIFKNRILLRPKNVVMDINKNGYLMSRIIKYPDYINIDDIIIKWQIPKNVLMAAIDNGLLAPIDGQIDRLSMVNYVLKGRCV